MQNQRASFYARLKPEDETLPTSRPGPPQLEHTVDKKKLRSRCCMALSSALLIAFVLWLFDPPAGHEEPPNPENTHTELKFVLVLHRHGARSSLHNYTFEDGIEWEVPPGKLLNVGFKQGFELGRDLRSRYWDNLSSSLVLNVTSASTDVDRTVDTANSVLMGLLTDNETKVEAGNCSCRPTGFTQSDPECVAACIGVDLPSDLPNVTVWKKEDKEGPILRQYSYCDGYHKWKNEVLTSKSLINSSKEELSDEFSHAERLIGNTTVCSDVRDSDGKNDTVCHETTVSDLEHIWSTLQCLRAQSSSQNGPYTNLDESSARLEKAALWYWHHIYAVEKGPLFGGILLDRVISEMEAVTEQRPPADAPRGQFHDDQGYSMILYSAHDSTLASLLAAMNVEDWHLPLFTSHIVFELYGPDHLADEQVHYVKIIYDDEVLLVNGCDYSFCKLSDFTDAMADRRRTVEDCHRVQTKNVG